MNISWAFIFADVSYYVTENSVLDREAHVPVVLVCTWWTAFTDLCRSVYLTVFCSLNAGEDRLSMACEMHINGEGKVFKL